MVNLSDSLINIEHQYSSPYNYNNMQAGVRIVDAAYIVGSHRVSKSMDSVAA